ncbi:Fc.00g048470.m01.CDS01 [Cosmosporella sp. VM-42]
MATLLETIAWVCLTWSIIVIVVGGIGISAIFKYFSRRPAPPVSPKLGTKAPHVTVIRPVKGLEPHLYECIAASFRQEYPLDKLSIRLCVEDQSDPAYPTLKQIVDDFPAFDARVLVETEDPVLNGIEGHVDNMGPNPKIRNVSRAYREAKGDIIWVMDCNVWIARDVMGRMVDKLMGYAVGGGSTRPYKFTHQLPIVVDTIDYSSSLPAYSQTLLSSAPEAGPHSEQTILQNPGIFTKLRSQGGGRLDEMFFATNHAKFYGAINAVGVAPCVVGKSNMFRKSQLDHATNPTENPILPKDDFRPLGIDYFSHHICEDHLIGDLLWKTDIPGYSNHGIVWGDLAVQPMTGMSVAAYSARRARWLRARKLTVLAATLVEPGVESFVCCAYLAFALTTLPFFNGKFGIPQTWGAMALTWLIAMVAWMTVDWFSVHLLHSGITLNTDVNTPAFAKGQATQGGVPRRTFLEWFPAWFGREALALPIWIWAVLLGRTVTWRGKSFRVRYDTTVYEVTDGQRGRNARTPEIERAASRNKRRVD